MRVGIVVVMLISLSIRPSLAQENENMGCWLRISNCLSNAGSGDETLGSCCPIIKQEIEDERECFCLLRDTILQNETVASSFATIFTFCGISDSVETLCPAGSNDSSSAPAASPDSSPPSTISTSPTETPIPLPESPPADMGDCWTRIINCTDSVSESEMLQCCPIVKQEIANERECFCGAKAFVQEDSSDANAVSQYLNLCHIPGSFDKLCPAKNNNSTSGSRRASINGGTNNITYSIGLLPSSLLIIWLISVLI